MDKARIDVDHVARLARLELAPDEAVRLEGQLGAILGYVEQLAEVDVEGVEPMTHAIERVMPLRQDEVVPPLGAERGLAMAPRRDGPFVEVPRVIDEQGGGS